MGVGILAQADGRDRLGLDADFPRQPFEHQALMSVGHCASAWAAPAQNRGIRAAIAVRLMSTHTAARNFMGPPSDRQKRGGRIASELGEPGGNRTKSHCLTKNGGIAPSADR